MCMLISPHPLKLMVLNWNYLCPPSKVTTGHWDWNFHLYAAVKSDMWLHCLGTTTQQVLVAGNWIPSIVRQGDTPIQAIPSLVNPSLGKIRGCLLNSPPYHLCPFGHPAQQDSSVVSASLGLKQRHRASAVSVGYHCPWTSTLAPGPSLLCVIVQGG